MTGIRKRRRDAVPSPTQRSTIIVSAATAIIDHMDLFDGEPYVSLLPRRLVKFGGFALLIALAVIPSVRDWWIDQAVKHATHEIQPLFNAMLHPAQPSPSAPSHRHHS